MNGTNEATSRGFGSMAVVMAFLGGALAGAAAALLAAPASGAETRRRISGAVERSGAAVRRTGTAAGAAARAAGEVFTAALHPEH